jgi:hypothetical protein
MLRAGIIAELGATGYVLLLNEVQKPQRRMETLEQVLDDLREQIRSMKR